MQRRDILISAAAMALVPAGARALDGAVDYRPGLVDEALARGETVFLDFAAVWCTTCRAQERVINQLTAENPAYLEAVTFIRVDWDTYRTAEITRRLNIPRRSTLVVLKGDRELGRIVAGTGTRIIRELLDTALAAATA